MSIKTLLMAAVTVAGLALPGVASAQAYGQYRAPGYDQRYDDHRYGGQRYDDQHYGDGRYGDGRYDARDGRHRWEERRRWQELQRRRAWERAHRHHGHDRYDDGRDYRGY